MSDLKTSTSTVNEFPLTYRHAEVEFIMRCVRAGDSCSVMGPSGVAKSNLCRFLRQESVRRHYLGEAWQDYLLVPLDGNEVTEMTEEAVSALLIDRLLAAAAAYDAKNLSLSAAVKAVFGRDIRAIVFLFDQFDAVYQTLSGRFFANLRAIRDEYKYRISFLLLSRNQLTALAASPEREEFEELFSANTMGLGPYNTDDSLLLLRRVSSRYGRNLDPQNSQTLIELTGGHPGLLKAATIAVLNERMQLPHDQPVQLDALFNVPDMVSECEKLWNSISDAERQFLRRLSNPNPPRDKQASDLLQLKGLIKNAKGGFVAFSPLFAEYISRSKGVELATTKLIAGAIRIDTAGEVWINDEVVKPSLTKKELMLLEYLCLSPGRLRTKDEIIAVVYPDEYKTGAGVSDDALNAVVKRLRDRLEPYSGFGDKIVTVRGKGYRLEST
ncbi:MAG TPA: winged helix-turn-helix domain-containing protein [Pyrinomonadaceae bacterium]|nr:winged helix-turn-helix domain-containing protein [Pyrinomonadaceae bacterium]